MKKANWLMMLLAAGLFSFASCNQGGEEAEEETATETVTEETPAVAETPAAEAGEQLAEHVCNDKCTAEAHFYKHGEKGHVCGAECEHPQAEGEHPEHPAGD